MAVALRDAAEIAAIGSKAKVNVLAHYLRESSFRYVDGSSLYIKIKQKLLNGRPEVKAQVNVVGQHIEAEVFESIIEIRVRTFVNEVEIYTADFNFATVVSIEDADAYDNDVKQYIITAGAAKLAFPFARRVLFDITRDSGSTPISLDPIDFEKMYFSSREAAAKAAQDKEAADAAQAVDGGFPVDSGPN